MASPVVQVATEALAPPQARRPPLAIIMNVRAGHQDSQQRLEAVREALDKDGRAYKLWPVGESDRLPDVLAQALPWAVAHHGALVAAGGDGTLNTVAQEAYRARLPVGILPQGTFNYVARSHGIPVDLESSLASLLRSEPTPVPAGRVNGQLFLVNASMGLYPQVLEDREAFKAQWGRYRFNAALSALLTVLREHRFWDLELELGDRTVAVRTATLFVGVNRFQLDKLGLPESAKVDEGQLAAVMVKPVSRWGLILLALRGAMGRLAEADAAVNFAFRRLTVRPRSRSRTVAVAVDGEVIRFQAPLTFDVAPEPLQLLLPPPQEGST